ncbi:MAG: hypothetical protein K2P58_03325 [Hyphomonadaceae bacterium]|nr:hypothetical protein [Hyphomonadaceae bacterium]
MKPMSGGDLIWILLLLVMIQPLLARRLNEARRQSAISAIERQRGSRLILLVHRQETVSFLGIPVLRYIDLDDAEAVARAIELTNPATPIDVVLHNPGRPPDRFGAGCAGTEAPPGQSHGVRSPLRNVRRNAHCARGRRDCYVAERHVGRGRPPSRRAPRLVADEGRNRKADRGNR